MRDLAMMSVLCASTLAACGDPTPIATQAVAIQQDRDVEDDHLFAKPLPHTNGRACATCHVEDQHFVLLPSTANARYLRNPADPLFNPIDADDPSAVNPTYDHMRKQGLIRVHVALPGNMDVIDAAGTVITNAQRTVALWRAVPTVENTALTAPYQYDGRAATLQSQALGALQEHSQINPNPTQATLDQIAAFEQTVFSSEGVAGVAEALKEGKPAPDPDPHFSPGSMEAQGKALFQQICAVCHGGPRGEQFTNQAVHDTFFIQLNPDGSPRLDPVTGLPLPQTGYGGDNFINLGISGLTYLQQTGAFPNPNGLSFPQYRFRFYTDGTRTTTRFDSAARATGPFQELLPPILYRGPGPGAHHRRPGGLRGV